jgi:L-fucose isomerase-like protein
MFSPFKKVNNMDKGIVSLVAASTLGEDIGKNFASQLEKELESRGVDASFIGTLSSPDKISEIGEHGSSAILVATGGTESIIVAVGKLSRTIHLFYHDSYNSLPSALEAAAALRELGKIVHLHRIEEVSELADFIKKLSIAANGALRLSRCKLGVIGGVSDWLVYSRTSVDDVKRKLGTEIVNIPLGELVDGMEKGFTLNEAEPSKLGAAESKVSPLELSKALTVHKSLEKLVKKYDLCGLTVKCFDLIVAKNTTACLSMALMNSRAFPAACEGDVPLMISMALGEFVTGRPAFMGNPSKVSEEEVLIAHCTSPLISRFRLMTHFESGLGVGVSVEYPVGEKATLFRIDPKLEVLRIGLGQIKKWGWRSDLCRTQILLELKGADKILKKSIGNHYALILGDWTEEISNAAEILGLNIEGF